MPRIVPGIFNFIIELGLSFDNLLAHCFTVHFDVQYINSSRQLSDIELTVLGLQLR